VAAGRRAYAAGPPLAAAIDAGTTGARAIAFDLGGVLVAEVRQPYPTRSPRPGWAEQDARDWAECAAAALRALVARARPAGTIRAIGLTGQCPTMVVADARGRPLRAGMLYRDNRAVAEALEMRDRIGDEVMHRRTGHLPEAFHVGPKLLWIRRNEPGIYASTRLVLQPRDVVLHRLTGVIATDETHANATLLFNLRRRAWDQRLLGAFGVDPALFPAALPPSAIAGEIPQRIAAELGLDAGVPVVVGAADSQCAAFGAGVTAPGPVSEMAGASSCLNSVVRTPLDDLRVTHYSHVVPDCFTTELGVNTTGSAIGWAVRTLRYEGFDELASDAARFRRRLQRRAAGTGGTAAVDAAPLFLPYLGDGERDDPAVRAGFLGLSDRHDRAALAFAVIEGVSLAVRSVLAVLAQAGSPLTELRVGGGGARLGLAGQLKADLLGCRVLHLDLDPAGFGAAMLAADAAGLARESGGAGGAGGAGRVGEAGAVVAATVRRARRFVPSRWGSAFERDRAAWFDQVRPSAAVHSPQQPS
jgi:sugar (pentulose or hexulose) kinase